MSLTITRVPDGEERLGRKILRILDVTLDASYPATNGYVINASDAGLKVIYGAQVIGGNKAAGALNFVFDFNAAAGELSTAVRLRAFFPTGGAGTSPVTLIAPIPTGGAITVTNGAITAGAITNGAITPGAISFATNTTPVLSDNSHPVFTEATPSQAATTAANPTQAATTASQAAGSGVPGIAKEAANTCNLSTIILRIQFLGF